MPISYCDFVSSYLLLNEMTISFTYSYWPIFPSNVDFLQSMSRSFVSRFMGITNRQILGHVTIQSQLFGMSLDELNGKCIIVL